MSDVIEIGRTLVDDVSYLYYQDYIRKETVKNIYPSTSNTPARFYYCPPIHDFFKNCFGIYAVSDVNILVENNKLHVLDGHKHSFPLDDDNNIAFDKLFNIGCHSLEYMIPEELFISDEENVYLEISPHPHARYKNVISSRLNIFDWFRQIHIPYYQDSLNEPFHLNFKKDEPLAMIRFITPDDRPIKFVELDYNKIKKYTNARDSINLCNSNYDTKNYKTWKKYFKFFSNKRPKKLIDYARIDK